MKTKSFFVLFVFLFFCKYTLIYGQIDSTQKENYRSPNTFISIDYHQGPIWAHHEKLQPLIKNGFISVDARLGFQSVGNAQPERAWQQKLAFPFYGIGISYTDFRSEALGKPITLYGFVNLPLRRFRKSSWNIEFATGLGFNFNPYNFESNSQNIAIGSPINAFVGLGTNYEFKISEKFDIRLGARLAHYSNGTVTQPNLGLNLVDFSVGGKYYFKRTPFQTYTFERFKPTYEIISFATFAQKQVPVNNLNGSLSGSPNYTAASISVDFLRQFNSFQKIGVGVAIYYDQSLEGNPKQAMTTLSYFTQGIHISSEIKAGRFALMGNLGFYTFRKVMRDFPVYTRLGFRYYCLSNLFFTGILKAHLGMADMAEWGVGYRFK
ncbi:MAG: hypothetical protein EAZ44_02655 [Cytophagia bacterium]|nr:MAG: hypothetical protein EAZ44_02655 [Cytophagia bacterium]TAG44225.1 MAG: hypothetical protein EAZ31_02765 [Cytophagia bacterium]